MTPGRIAWCGLTVDKTPATATCLIGYYASISKQEQDVSARRGCLRRVPKQRRHADQHDMWCAYFGQPPGSGTRANAKGAIPEPATQVLLVYVVAGWCLRRARAA